MGPEVICQKCGWVHFEVTRKFAEDEVARFNAYYKTLTRKEQKQYYGGKVSSVKSYEHCMLCNGSYKNFRKARKEELPFGSTVSPIIRKQD